MILDKMPSIAIAIPITTTTAKRDMTIAANITKRNLHHMKVKRASCCYLLKKLIFGLYIKPITPAGSVRNKAPRYPILRTKSDAMSMVPTYSRTIASIKLFYVMYCSESEHQYRASVITMSIPERVSLTTRYALARLGV